MGYEAALVCCWPFGQYTLNVEVPKKLPSQRGEQPCLSKKKVKYRLNHLAFDDWQRKKKVHRRAVCLIMIFTATMITVSLSLCIPPLLSKWNTYTLNPPDVTTAPAPSSSPEGTYYKSAVSADAQPCAQVGKDILQKNGSAVDAAIATVFCIGVAEPQRSGVGGGLFMVIYQRENESCVVLNAREAAPAKSSRDMFGGDASLSLRGGLSIAVPSEVRGLWEAHKRYGVIPWEELVSPAIDMCRAGIPVSRNLAQKLREYQEAVVKNQPMRSFFTNPETGNLLKEGELMRNAALADTLELISQTGDEELYSGELARNLTTDIQKAGGIVTAEDLSAYRVKWESPVSTSLAARGSRELLTLMSALPPAGGVVLAYILNILREFDLASWSGGNINDEVLLRHRMAEAFKHGYAQRTHLGDPDYVNVTEVIEKLLSKEFGLESRRKISDTKTFPDVSYYGALGAQAEDGGTSHVSVLAPNGDAVSVTTTINQYFGSGVMSASTGIILNDSMDDFSSPNIVNTYGVPPSPSNFIDPGKRPLSSMSPTIVTDNNGDVRLVVGAAGGTRITTAVAQAVVDNIWLGKSIKESIDDRRIHHQLLPDTLYYEYGVTKQVVAGLRRKGHSLLRQDQPLGVVNGLERGADGSIKANADFRKEGSIGGF